MNKELRIAVNSNWRKGKSKSRITMTPYVAELHFLEEFFYLIPNTKTAIQKNTISFKKGYRTYTATIEYLSLKLEVKEEERLAFRYSFSIANLPMKYRKKLSQYMPADYSSAKKRQCSSSSNCKEKLTNSPVKFQTYADRSAIQNFRLSTQAQPHVRSRKASEEMTVGRTLGHVSDLD